MEMTTTNVGQYFFAYGDQSGREKIVVGDGSGYHYTLLLNQQRGIIDLHKTIEKTNGEKEYESILQMRFFTFYRLMANVLPKYNFLIRQIWFSSRINAGKLKRHKCFLLPMQGQEDKVNYIFKQQGRKKFRFRTEIQAAHAEELIISVDDLPHDKTEIDCYQVYTSKKKSSGYVGQILRHPADARKQSFYFVSKRKWALFNKAVRQVFINELRNVNFEKKSMVLEYLESTN